MKKRNLFFVLFVLFVLSTYLFSTIINVPGDQPTIQDGIFATSSSDTVLVADGTYLENLDFDGRSITVASWYLTTQDTAHITQTIIDGNQNGSVVLFESGETSASILSGFTITNGNGNQNQYGGGIIIGNQSGPTLENLVITENTGERGAGVYCDDYSELNLSRVLVSNNIANNRAGGIYCVNSNMHMEDCVIYENEALNSHSAALNFYINSDNLNMYDLEIEHCYFIGNESDGGSVVNVYLTNGLNTTIGVFVRNSHFWENYASNNSPFTFWGDGVELDY